MSIQVTHKLGQQYEDARSKMSGAEGQVGVTVTSKEIYPMRSALESARRGWPGHTYYVDDNVPGDLKKFQEEYEKIAPKLWGRA